MSAYAFMALIIGVLALFSNVVRLHLIWTLPVNYASIRSWCGPFV